jgi:hypothetical protein
MVAEGAGPALPSKLGAGATVIHAGATRPVRGKEASASPPRPAGMPTAAGEKPREPRSAVPSRERRRPKKSRWLMEPQATDPQAGKSESANLGGHRLGETKAACNRLLHANPEPEGKMEAPHRTENECRIARVLKDGTEFLTL